MIKSPSPELSNRKAAITQGYIESLDDTELLVAQEIADGITQAGPLASTVVIIPVAAHQEAEQVPRALNQYSKQVAPHPFSVVLGLNCPTAHSQSQRVKATLDAVEEAKKDYTGLDVRTASLQTYDEPVMGKIRRDLWNGVTIATQQSEHSEFKGDTIALNHDIDLIRMWPRFVRSVQERYVDMADASPLPSPLLRALVTPSHHAASTAHPNISRAASWHDYMVRTSSANPYFEIGAVIPMTAYAREGGFNSTKRIGEMIDLLGRMPAKKVITGANMATSPRRYIRHMEQAGYNIWSEDTFSASDDCRESTDFPDISRERMVEIIEPTIPRAAQDMVFIAIDKVIEDIRLIEGTDSDLYHDLLADDKFFMDQARKRVARLRATGERVLGRVIGEPALAADLIGRMDRHRFDEMAKSTLDLVFLQPRDGF